MKIARPSQSPWRKPTLTPVLMFQTQMASINMRMDKKTRSRPDRSARRNMVLGLLVASILLGCDYPSRDSPEPSQSARATRNASQEGVFQKFSDEAERALCAKVSPRQSVCFTDFTRLGAFYPFLENIEISITGYLVVDGGLLALYASEQDYQSYVRSRSVEIRVYDEAERDQFSGMLYRNVNIRAVYSKDFESNNKRGRLGFLRAPFSIYKVDPRLERADIDSVLIYVEPCVEEDCMVD